MKPKMGYSDKGKNRRVLTPAKLKAKREAEVVKYAKEFYKNESKEIQKAGLAEMLRVFKLR
jgi:hypothetical protein